MMRGQCENSDLISMHQVLVDLKGRLPQPAAVVEMRNAQRVADLFESGNIIEAELAAREVMSEQSAGTRSYIEVNRLLVEALIHQERWEEAIEESIGLLEYLGPSSLHNFPARMFVHNVGFSCAVTWVFTG